MGSRLLGIRGDGRLRVAGALVRVLELEGMRVRDVQLVVQVGVGWGVRRRNA